MLVPLDRAGDRPRLAPRRLPVARRLPRHAPADAARRTRPGPTTARPTTPSAAPPAPARTRRTSSSASSDGAVVAFDTELFGHHWHEGVTFLEARARAGGRRPASRRARRRPRRTSRRRAGASGRDLRTWSAPRAGLDAAPRRAGRARRRRRRARALRELLALQSSDWAFLITHGTAGDYPRERAAATSRRSLSRCVERRSDDLRNLAPQLARLGLCPALSSSPGLP